jgi:hypothetical protein
LNCVTRADSDLDSQDRAPRSEQRPEQLTRKPRRTETGRRRIGRDQVI